MKKTKNGQIHYERIGKGTPIVFFPGGPGLSHSYLYDSFSKLSSDFDLIFFDPLGCGKSDSSDSINIQTTAESAVEFLQQMELKNEEFYILCHSWGAFLLAYILNKELLDLSPKKIILMNPVPFNKIDFDLVAGKLFKRVPESAIIEITKLSEIGSDEAGSNLMNLALPYYTGSDFPIPPTTIEYRIPTYNTVASSMNDFTYEDSILKVINKCSFIFGKNDYIEKEDLSALKRPFDYYEVEGGHFAFLENFENIRRIVLDIFI